MQCLIFNIIGLLLYTVIILTFNDFKKILKFIRYFVNLNFIKLQCTIQVGELFEEGMRTDRSSDSSRRTQMSRNIRAWSSGGTATNTQTFSAINRLFSERIDIFSPVQFSRVSITTGIIKISLKV